MQQLTRPGISLELELDPDVRKIQADVDALEQLLINLVANACEAMPDGGVLHVRTENTRLGGGQTERQDLPPGWYVSLVVADTGRGMPPETIKRIFEPFYSRKISGKGTGLGLTIVRRIVEHLHGHVRVDSTPGRGTTFRICFPAVEEPAHQAAG